MKPETRQWIDKAEGDWRVVQREVQASDPVWDVVCFLAQQCAEKYVKALLEEDGIHFRKTHDLVVLVESAGERLRELDERRSRLAHLSVFGIAARYPGVVADEAAAEEAVKVAEHVRSVLRHKLGLRNPKSEIATTAGCRASCAAG